MKTTLNAVPVLDESPVDRITSGATGISRSASGEARESTTGSNADTRRGCNALDSRGGVHSLRPIGWITQKELANIYNVPDSSKLRQQIRRFGRIKQKKNGLKGRNISVLKVSPELHTYLSRLNLQK